MDGTTDEDALPLFTSKVLGLFQGVFATMWVNTDSIEGNSWVQLWCQLSKRRRRGPPRRAFRAATRLSIFGSKAIRGLCCQNLACGPILDDPSCGSGSSGLPCGQLGRPMQCSGRNTAFQPGRFCRLCLRSRDAFPHSLKQSRALASSHQHP